MIRRLCAAVHRPLQVAATLGHRRTDAAASRPHFLGFVKPYSVSSVGADDPSFLTAFFLSKSCGISDSAALSISKKVQLDAHNKALSVLTLLKDYGFDEAHLVRLVDRYPRVLSMDVEKILEPKLEAFRRIGLVGAALPEFLSARPGMLSQDVEKRLLPNIELLKSMSITDANIVNTLKHARWSITFDSKTTVLPKVDALRAYGVPDDVLLMLLTRYGYAWSTDTARFNEILDEIKKMGISPKKTTFAHALGVLSVLSKKKWEEKVENLRDLGWSQNHILEIFAKNPYIVRTSTEKIRKTVKLLQEKLGWTPATTVKYSSVVMMNLEKRLMPRYEVLHILIHKGLIEPGFSGHYFLMSNDNFMKRFVAKYQEKAPEIVDAIKGVSEIV